MATAEARLQEVAGELHVQYYAFFRVLEADGLYFPTAEVYEEGRWRPLVIGGRPYHNPTTAHLVLQDAEQVQEEFLKAMQQVKTASGLPPDGLTNPLDNWKYCLELD
mgnify:FL=1